MYYIGFRINKAMKRFAGTNKNLKLKYFGPLGGMLNFTGNVLQMAGDVNYLFVHTGI